MAERVKKILAVLILAVIGLGVGIATEVIHSRLASDVNYVSFCNVSANVNCDVVLGSRYALLAGVSVSAWAILYYLMLIGGAVGVAATGGAQLQERIATLMLVLAVWGLLFSIYMAATAFAVLHSVCVMCSALYLVNIALFVAAWWLRSGLRVAGHREAMARARPDRLGLAGSIVATVVLVAIGAWEALGRGVHPTDAAEIARQRPDFYRWYFAQPLTQVPLDAGRHSRGNPDAPVTIVEFSDFECAHCAAFHQSLEDVLHRMGQSVRVEFRHFPLDSACNPQIAAHVHPDACLAAAASECAAKQGKFWQYHNLLFANQQQLGRPFLIGYASRLGLDVARFTACLGSEEPRAGIERDVADGALLGIDSTPTVFINGRTIKGALDPDLLTDAVTLARANR